MSSVPATDLGNGSVQCGCGAVMSRGQQHWCTRYGHYVKNPTVAEKLQAQRAWERQQRERERRRKEFYGK